MCCLSILNCVHVLSVCMFAQFELCTCSLSLSCANVRSVWVVQMFAQFELCKCSLNLHVHSVWVVYMFPQFELCKCSLSLSCANVRSVRVVNSNWENMCTTRTERTFAQFKIERQHIYIFLHTIFGFLSTLAPHSNLSSHLFTRPCLIAIPHSTSLNLAMHTVLNYTMEYSCIKTM